MEPEGRTASIDGFSQEISIKEDSRAQTQCLYINGDHVNPHTYELSNATKIFVGGLPADLTTEEFKAYFEKFGSIQDAVVMSDKGTNRPRRFGFVTFDSPETATNVLKNKFHELKNKRVEVKKAVPKERMSGKSGNYYDTYNGIYNGNTFPYVATASYGNYSGYYYNMNNYGYGAYNGLGYGGFSYVSYTYQSSNAIYYGNTYQSPYYYPDTYCYRNPHYYGNNRKYRNRTPVVKKNSHVNNGDDSDAARKNDKLSSELNDEERVVRDVLENGDGDGDHAKVSGGVSMCCNGDGDVDGSFAEGVEALSLYSDGSREQMGVDGQSSSCTTES